MESKKERIAVVKAAMMNQLLHYIHEQGSRLSTKSKILCIAGDDILLRTLRDLYKKSPPNIGHNIIDPQSSGVSCDVIYFAPDIAYNEAIKMLRQRSELPLILGCHSQHLIDYEMISFLEVMGKINLYVNLGNLEKAGFTASPDLLDVAQKVKR